MKFTQTLAGIDVPEGALIHDLMPEVRQLLAEYPGRWPIFEIALENEGERATSVRIEWRARRDNGTDPAEFNYMQIQRDAVCVRRPVPLSDLPLIEELRVETLISHLTAIEATLRSGLRSVVEGRDQDIYFCGGVDFFLDRPLTGREIRELVQHRQESGMHLALRFLQTPLLLLDRDPDSNTLVDEILSEFSLEVDPYLWKREAE